MSLRTQNNKYIDLLSLHSIYRHFASLVNVLPTAALFTNSMLLWNFCTASLQVSNMQYFPNISLTFIHNKPNKLLY